MLPFKKTICHYFKKRIYRKLISGVMCFSLPNPSVIKRVSCLSQKFENFPLVAQIDSHFTLFDFYLVNYWKKLHYSLNANSMCGTCRFFNSCFAISTFPPPHLSHKRIWRDRFALYLRKKNMVDSVAMTLFFQRRKKKHFPGQ